MAYPEYVGFEDIAGTLRSLGTLWIVSSIVVIMTLMGHLWPIYIAMLSHAEQPVEFWAVSLGAIGTMSTIFIIYVLARTIVLAKYTGDRKFSMGPGLIIASLLVSMATGCLALFLVIQQSVPRFPTLLFLLAMLAVIYFVVLVAGIILLGVAFYGMGEENHVPALSIGGILLIFLPFVSQILVGFGLRELATSVEMWDSPSLEKEIAETLRSPKVPVMLRYLSRTKRIPMLALRLIIARLIERGELFGRIEGGTYYPSWSLRSRIYA